MEDTRFWVIYRHREFGPFDYEWSPDLRGLAMLYRGVKFGEICGEEELFADLKEFKLPMKVVEVASLTLGCVLYGIHCGFNPLQRRRFLHARLRTTATPTSCRPSRGELADGVAEWQSD
jgi:hypothetical protein